MARSKKGSYGDLFDFLARMGIIFFIPFLIIAVFTFYSLKSKYIRNDSIQRVIDIRRCFPTLWKAGISVIAPAFMVYSSISSINDSQYNIRSIIIFIILLCLLLAVAYIFAKHIAIIYLGIIIDSKNDMLIFPHDMQSYGIMDYLKLRFIPDYTKMDNVKLSQITKLTRGYGNELYVHGIFGSRAIIMSSKQKRDECLAMIQDLTGKGGCWWRRWRAIERRGMKLIEEAFETLLFNSRFITILAVLGALVSSFVMFIKGTMQIVNGIGVFYAQIAHFRLGEAHGSDTLVAHFVSSVDNYLFATVLLIFSMGLYELFISEIDPASRNPDSRPNWLKVESLDDLKSSLGKVILMILIVSFFEQSLSITYSSSLDLLYLGIGILLVAGALYVTHLGQKH